MGIFPTFSTVEVIMLKYVALVSSFSKARFVVVSAIPRPIKLPWLSSEMSRTTVRCFWIPPLA